uniref:Uncharacterized protein n=1 Tax=Fulvimarina pelagi TaxID=217511 RepID=A0A0N7KYY2_9HYPH|nr:hypothetical protein [Fulvimarina pelagi]
MTAEILLAEAEKLDFRTHRTVEHEDAFRNGLRKGFKRLRWIPAFGHRAEELVGRVGHVLIPFHQLPAKSHKDMFMSTIDGAISGAD